MHFNRYKILCLAISLLLTAELSALSFPALSDSLTAYANSKAPVGNVSVKRVRTRGNAASVYTCKTLSCLSLSPDEIKDLRRNVSIWLTGKPGGNIQIYTDGYEIGELVTMRYRHLPAMHLPPAVKPLVENTDRAYNTSNGLEGRHIALWGSHGWYYNNQLDRWLWQRAKLWTTVEDLYTSSYTMPYLVPMLENAGAVVLQPRERDVQTEQVILDNTAVSETTEGCLAEVAVPAEGNYSVYLWYTPDKQASNRTEVEITHKDQTTHYHVNMQIGAGTWIYIGTHAFAPGQPARITIHAPKEQIRAIRLGGGVDSIAGVPRWVEGASVYLPYAGIPDSIINHTEGENTYINDYACRGKWVNYLLGGSALSPKTEGLRIPVDLSMAFHSDAGVRGGDTIIGTLMIYTDKDDDNSRLLPMGDSRLQCRYLGDYVQTQIVEDMRALHAPDWTRRSLKNSGYAEARQPKVPSFLLELLSHQNYGDMRYGLDPNVKFTISRAIYKGMLKYLCTSRGAKYIVQPLPVKNMQLMLDRTKNDKPNLIVRWQPQTDTLEPTAEAEYYIVYMRETQYTNGQAVCGDWSNGTRVERETFSVPIRRGVRYDVRVVAGNKGGISMPSETHCAYLAPQDKGTVLIVNAFDRVSAPKMVADSMYAGIVPQSYAVADGMDISFIGEQYDYLRSSEWLSDDNCGWGACYCDQQYTLTAGNTHDYPLWHGDVLTQMGYSYVSMSANALSDSAELANFAMIDVIMGKQQTGTSYTAFSPSLRRAMSIVALQGGRILLSGMYIGSEAEAANDAAFTNDVLRFRLRGAHATRNGLILFNAQTIPPAHSELFPQAQLLMQPNEQVICCENPEGLTPCNGAVAAGRYMDSGMTAAIAYDGNYRILALPFMIESTTTFRSLYERCVAYLFKEKETL